MVSQLRKLVRTTAAGTRAARLDAGGVAYIKLHSGRKQHMKGYVFRKMMGINPIIRQSLYKDFTFMDTQAMSINNYKPSTDAINLCQWVSFGSSTPGHVDEWIRVANLMREDNVAVTQGDSVMKRYTECAAEFKNENRQPVEIDFWTFYPRRDIPISQTVGGTYDPLSRQISGDNSANAPLLLVNAFNNDAAEADTYIYTDAAPKYYERDASPFQCTQWCSLLRAASTKPRHITLQGGQSVKINVTDWASKTFSMRKYGLFDGTTISANYHYLKDNGPIILARIRGCMIHNEASTSGDLANSDLSPAYGAYSVTALMQYKQHLTASIESPQLSDLPAKIRAQTGVFGFTATAPYNPIADITQADTRGRDNIEGPFNT